MSFVSPWWLLGLVPWAALAVWLLMGQRKTTLVPFLRLWETDQAHPTRRRWLRLPPVGVACAMAAILLAILSAADPRLGLLRSPSGPPVTLIVDRGLTMSARTDGTTRFAGAVSDAAQELAARLGDGRAVDLQTVPHGIVRQTKIADLTGSVADIAPTAVDTEDSIAQAVQERLANTDGLVIVATDRPLPVDDPRLIQITPARPIDNVGIALLAARDGTRPQVMVRLRNDSPGARVDLTVESGRERLVRQVELPPRGQMRDYFLDLPTLDIAVTASLPGDALAADDRAHLLRHRRWPRIERAAPMPPAIERMLSVYAHQYPPGDDSRAVLIVRDTARTPLNQPAIILTATATTRPAPAAPVVTPHPVTATVDWPAALADAALGAHAPDGWTSLVGIGDRPAVAVRAEPSRQVWLAFDSDRFVRSSDFVVLWKNMLDWTGEGGDQFSWRAIGLLGAQWRLEGATQTTPMPEPGLWPGIWRGPDDQRIAVNAPAVGLPQPATSDWRERLAQSPSRHSRGRSLASWSALGAVGLLLAAAATWPRRANAAVDSP